jgi:hypothetical protein
VLESDLSTRLKYFNANPVHHHNFDEALGTLMSAIQFAGDDSLVYLIAPAGTGKTAMSRAARTNLLETYGHELEHDLNRVLFGYTSLKNSVIPLTWPEVLRLILDSYGEPLIDRKIAAQGFSFAGTSRDERRSSDRFLQAVLSYQIRRQLLVNFLDNANFLQKISTSKPQWLLDPLIGLCEKVPWVLLGTTTLILHRNLSLQLGHRSKDIFFYPYRLTDPADQSRFVGALKGFEENLPVKEPPDLVSNASYLMEGCVGSIGLLAKWLYEAMVYAASKESPTIALEHLQRTAHSAGILKEAAKEIADFESRLLDIDETEKENQFAALYEVEGEWKKRNRRGKKIADPAVDCAKKNSKKNGNSQPGKRNPGRDLIGIPPELRGTA